jgi:hypothetical protein
MSCVKKQKYRKLINSKRMEPLKEAFITLLTVILSIQELEYRNCSRQQLLMVKRKKFTSVFSPLLLSNTAGFLLIQLSLSAKISERVRISLQPSMI